MVLTVEELEAIRLKDLVCLDQEQSAERMGVARTTFQRVLYSARSKIADALVNGKALRVEGGGAYQLPEVRKFRCNACGHEFEALFGNGQRGMELTCPSCGKEAVQRQGGWGSGRGGCWRRQEGNDRGGSGNPEAT